MLDGVSKAACLNQVSAQATLEVATHRVPPSHLDEVQGPTEIDRTATSE
jgi:hypothetical protein